MGKRDRSVYAPVLICKNNARGIEEIKGWIQEVYRFGYPQSLISPVSLFPRVGNCLIDISNDVIYVLQADGDSN
jgi:hypothetical protein